MFSEQGTVALVSLLLCLAAMGLGGSSRNYKIRVGDIETDENCQKMVPWNDIILTKISENETAITGSFLLAYDFPNETTLMVLGLEKQSNGEKYNDKPSFNYTKRLCDFMETDDMIYPEVLDSTDFPEKCPILAGNYTIDNYIIEGEHLPDQVPGNEYYCLDISLFGCGNTLCEVKTHTKIYVRFEKIVNSG